MNRQPHPRPRPLRARLVLLVLAVLTGLVAMHGPATAGLPNGPRIQPAAHPMPTPVASADESHRSDSEAGADCRHGTNNHVHHADPTCAAGGTSSAPVLPAPAPATVAAAADASAATRRPADSLDNRAPPSLSELQLLRM